MRVCHWLRHGSTSSDIQVFQGEWPTPPLLVCYGKGGFKGNLHISLGKELKGAGGTIWGIINRCTHGVRGSQPSVCEIETPNSWSCFGSKRRFCWKQRETRSCLEGWWIWSFLLKNNPSSSSSLLNFVAPPMISTTAPAEVSLDGLHWLWRF